MKADMKGKVGQLRWCQGVSVFQTQVLADFFDVGVVRRDLNSPEIARALVGQ
jgi:hypothetical protein